MRFTRAQRQQRWEAVADRRAAERVERERQQAADRQKRQQVGALARIRLTQQLPADVAEAFDDLVVWLRTDGRDADWIEVFRLIEAQAHGTALLTFIGDYERAGGTVYDYRARRAA